MKILLATDGSKDAVKAQTLIESLALQSPTEILVLSVVPMPHLVTPGVGLEGELRPPQPSPEAMSSAKAAATAASHALARAGVATEVLVRAGSPAEVICSLADERNVDLVVVGSRGRSALGRFFLGSVSSQVLKHASVPVLVARPSERPIRNVLVGIDDSENARRAVSYLAQFPLPKDTRTILLSVVYMPPPFYGAAGYYETEELNRALETVRAAAETDAQRSLNDAEAILTKSFAVAKRTVLGVPARALVETAETEGADLIVLGSRGLSAVERLMMGSVSLHVSHHARTSVLIVR